MRLVSPIGSAFLLIAALDLAAAQPAPSLAPASPVAQPTAEGLRIDWEVKNRFRLFRNEHDFQRQVAASRSDGVLGAEQRLARDTAGRGWARNVVTNLCVDGAGNVTEVCVRDGVREIYLAPADHRVGVIAANAPAGAACAWSFDDGDQPARQQSVPCEEEVTLRVRYGRPTIAVVEIARADGTADHASTEILVRDVLIAGLGDSVASGDGNPDRAVVLADEGFCFRRFLGGGRSEYFRPSRAGYRGPKACGGVPEPGRPDSDWARYGARWMSAPCHRSLYGYQMRTALALAVENSRIAVTFVPLGCTGATIEDGLLSGQRARETACDGKARCTSAVPAQLAQLRDTLALARRQRPDRNLDLILLTIGANDIGFAQLVADVIIEATTERTIFRRAGLIGGVEEADQALARKLPGDFARLRTALKSFVGGNLARVVYVSYGNPATHAAGAPCPGGLDGFDIHPGFGVDPDRMRRVASFVDDRFLPSVKALATCQPSPACQEPATDRMTFVDAHQSAFGDHGFCARAETDPAFDTACFSATGQSFHNDPVEGATSPLVCERPVGEFRPYASRARWIRTANDSYFIAMTYPEGLPASLQPTDIHDATWGATSAVYGGAIHPSAEGHAAMADAALPAVREVLGLSSPTH